MTIQTQQINLKLHQFDFNNQDVNFVNRKLQHGYPVPLRTVADMLHWWGKERAANPETVVNYDVQVKLTRLEGKVMQPAIFQFITVGEYMREPEMEIYLACGAEAILILKHAGSHLEYPEVQPGEVLIEEVDGQEALARFDAAFAKAKPTMPSRAIAAHYSLRSMITKIAPVMPMAYVRKGSLLFHANVGGVTAVMKIISTQVEFELTPAVTVTGDPA